MRIIRIVAFFLLGLSIFNSTSIAKKGFSIEGGLIYDRPTRIYRPYSNMKGGFGFIGDLGYDLFDQGGIELGVMHTSHNYELGIQNGAVVEESADKTAFFLKARAIPLKREKFELVVSAGIGFFDISGQRLDTLGISYDDDFSGLGFTGGLDFKYFITEGLAATLYIGSNIVDYKRYEILGYRAVYARKLPRGDSINWGFTLYHHIGIP